MGMLLKRLKTNDSLRRLKVAGCVMAVAAGAGSGGAATPDFGAHVLVFSPGMSSAAMQGQIDRVYAVEHENEFGAQRYAFLFLPGQYRVDVPVGFYTEVAGLGASPDDVHITGNVHADASGRNNNATVTFWRGVEGFAVTPTGGAVDGTMQWAVSQAAPMRRMHIEGGLALHQLNGWASGGWMADTKVDGNVGSGTQQQWISRNCAWGSWTGANWNMVFVGVKHAPAGEWPEPPYTKVAQTPVVREKPFLMVDAQGRYSVRVPALRRDSVGVTWEGGATAGRSIPLDRFYIAHAGTDTAATINAQLARGKDLLLTPGVYALSAALHVSRPDTVVLGLGFATLRPVDGTAAMTTADADGIVVAGVLFDAGPVQSPVLLQIGPKGSHADHAGDPISLHDVFFRVGGAGPGKTVENLEVNSNDTIIDHTWIWRADHGKGVGWGVNTSDNGLVVNGNDVTVYGLFVEHHQQYQVLWNGERGRTYFYQSEIPYDAPDQAVYSSGPGVEGWASYKVADGVRRHAAWGLGIYSVFNYPHVFLTRAMEVPQTPDVRFHHMITVALGRQGGAIKNVIDDAGGTTEPAPHRVTPKVTEYP
jgi:hypothetical protein